MENKISKQDLTQSYYDFISTIYIFDDSNFVLYEKVDGLVDAMYQIYKGGADEKQFFLMSCVVKEINKILHKVEKKSKKSLVVSK